MPAAGVHDDAGAFPRFDEAPARVRAEIGGVIAQPDGFVIGALGDINTRALHGELI